MELQLSMHFDETSTTQVKSRMYLTRHYWLPTHSKVWVNLYTSLFFGHAEGDSLAENLTHSERPWLPQPHKKRERRITVTAIRNISCKLQPQLDASSVQDKWKLPQADDHISTQDTKQVVEGYWNVVLQLNSAEGIKPYPSLQLVTL